MSQTVEKERPLHPWIEMCLKYHQNPHQLKLNLATVPSTNTDSQDINCSNNSNEVAKPPQLTTGGKKDTEEDTKRREIQNQRMRDYRARKKEKERLTKELLKMVTDENTKLKIENSNLKIENSNLKMALQALLFKDGSTTSSSF